jgi:hypothetical protein
VGLVAEVTLVSAERLALGAENWVGG